MILNKIRALSLLWAVSLSLTLHAQVVKEITVSQKASFTDHLSLEKDSRDMDLMVKFVFDEEANTLTVSLISYRSLFVFWDQVRYRPAFRCRKLRPKMLPYILQADPGVRLRLSKKLKKSLPRPRRKHVFNRWSSYESLQPVPQDYKLVNDYISQTFDIVNKSNYVTFTLRDIFVIQPKDMKRYEMFFARDLNTKYLINIQRNPCFGQEEQVKAAQNAQKAVSSAYTTLARKYGSGKVQSQESLKIFQEMQQLLLKQYPTQQAQSLCPDIQSRWDSYNRYVDSIRALRCHVVVDTTATMIVGGRLTPARFAPKAMLLQARQIDQLVARWINSKDVIERRDIVQRCEALISEGQQTIKAQHVLSPAQQKAIQVFQDAVQYYQSTCK